MEPVLRQRYQKTLDDLEAKAGEQSKETDIRTLVDLAERMRKDGNYSEAAMLEIIKKFDERITRV